MITYAVLFKESSIKAMTGKVIDQSLIDEIVNTVGEAVRKNVGGKIYEVNVASGKMRQAIDSGKTVLESVEKSIVVWVDHDTDPDAVYNEIVYSLDMIFNQNVIYFGGDRDSIINGRLVIE